MVHLGACSLAQVGLYFGIPVPPPAGDCTWCFPPNRLMGPPFGCPPDHPEGPSLAVGLPRSPLGGPRGSINHPLPWLHPPGWIRWVAPTPPPILPLEHGPFVPKVGRALSDLSGRNLRWVAPAPAAPAAPPTRRGPSGFPGGYRCAEASLCQSR